MRLAAALLSVLLVGPGALRAQVPSFWVGEWRLNVEKSIYNPGPPPYRRGAMRVELIGDQIRFAYDLVLPRGGTQHMEWTGQFDGTDYLVHGVDDFVTYAYSAVDERTYRVVTKVDQRTVAVTTVTVSPDGRTLTSTTGGRNARGEEITNTTVYERLR